MDFTTGGLDFYLSSLEEDMRSETSDLMATITRTSEGRVSINISEDVLEDFLSGLQALKENANNNRSQETKRRRREVHNLRAELKHIQAKYDLLSAEANDLRSSSEKRCGTMKETLKQACESKKNLEQVRAENKALQDKVDQLSKVREENQTLQDQVEAMKLELRLEKHLRATAENNAQMAAHSLSIQLFDKDTAEFEARSKAEQLEADLAFERTQTQTVKEKLDKEQKAFAKHREEAKKSAAQAQATYRAQREELAKIALSLKKAENLLETKQVCIQEKNILLETASKTKEQYMTQLEEQKRERDNVLAAFREDTRQFEQERVRWQEERRSLVQTNDSLTETMQLKEQEWEETNEIMNVHLKGLNAFIAQKMRRRKWWERLLH